MSAITFTEAQLTAAVNAAADMVPTSDSDKRAVLDFIVNATFTALTNPDAGIEDVLIENYDEDSHDEIRDVLDNWD